MAGETTIDLIPTTPLFVSKSVGQLVGQTFSVALRTTDLATNDITGVGKVPANSTTLGFFLQTDDLDSNGSEALVWTVLIGSTSVQAGITNATAKAGTFFACTTPVTVTTDTIIYMKSTTAAATAAAGTVNITPVYTTSA